MVTNSNFLLVLTGPTASGKDAVMKKLLVRIPSLQKVITTVTRPPRAGEKNGQDHHFVSVDNFRKMDGQGEFLETNEYGGHFYGTTKKEIAKALTNNLIWRIDPSAAAKVDQIIRDNFDPQTSQELLSKLIVIYLKVENLQIIKERLKKRGFPKQEIDQRLATDEKIWERNHQNFPNVVLNRNGALDETVKQVLKLLPLF